MPVEHGGGVPLFGVWLDVVGLKASSHCMLISPSWREVWMEWWREINSFRQLNKVSPITTWFHSWKNWAVSTLASKPCCSFYGTSVLQRSQPNTQIHQNIYINLVQRISVALTIPFRTALRICSITPLWKQRVQEQTVTEIPEGPRPLQDSACLKRECGNEMVDRYCPFTAIPVIQ